MPPSSSTEAAANWAEPANAVADITTAAAALIPAASARTPNEMPKRTGPRTSGSAARTPSRVRADGLRSSRPERSSGLSCRNCGSDDSLRALASVRDNDAVPALETLGWDDGWDDAFTPHRAAGLEPGRVAVPHRGAYDVLTSQRRDPRAPAWKGETRGSTLEQSYPSSGTGWRSSPGSRLRPSAPCSPAGRKFSRRAAHDPGSDVVNEQVVAANVDVVFIVAALTDVNHGSSSATSPSSGRAARNPCFF